VKILIPILVSALLVFPALGAPTRKAQTTPANLILITIDTVRADRLGCYGSGSARTPVMDSLARDSVVYQRAISQVPLTWPSHAVILTGTYPFQNGVRDFTGQPLAPQFRTVAQAFKEHGYATGAVISAFVLDRSWGLSRGFDSYDDAFSAEAFRQKDIGLVDRRATESVDRSIAWLSKNRGRKFFFWLHLYDPHSPYDPPEPYKTEFRDRPYDGEIAYADHELGRLVSWLKRQGLYERTAIVLLSDHGESLGEHGEKEHGFFIYDSTIRIPLMVKPASAKLKPGRVAEPVETTAVGPTLLRLANLSDPIQKQFQSAPLPEQDRSPESGAYSETLYPYSSFGWSPLHGLETARYHFIDAPAPELYDVIADPAETNNLAPRQSATVDVLRQKLRVIQQRTAPTLPSTESNPTLSPDALQKLRALGYVAYHSPASKEPVASGLADPKTKLEEFNAILRASDAFRGGNVAAGKQLLSKVAAEDPGMYIIPFMLAEASAREENWDEAATQFRKSLELNPDFDEAMTGLARALYFSADYAGARAWAQNALKQNPRNYRAWYELGIIETKSDRAAASSDFETALAIQGNFAPLHRELGMLQFHDRKYREAAPHLAKAIELGLKSAELYNFLGICNSQTGKLNMALDNYKQAIALDPNLAEAHLNLAYAYQQLKQPQAARPEYERACKLEQKFCKFVPK